MSEKFNLTWNDFQTNLTHSFSKLRTDTDLTDVTLISDDLEQVQAHRVVLSSCSVFFEHIFKKNKGEKHLSLYLCDIQTEDLKNVLDYIYNGQVKIFQEDLDRFLHIAQKIKLDGLLGSNNSDPEENGFVDRIDETQVENIPSSMKQNRPKERIEKENSILNQGMKHNTELTSELSVLEAADIQALDEKIRELTEVIGDRCKCKICGKETSGRNRRQDLGNHIETHLEGISFDCHLCGKTFRSRNLLRCHVSRICKNRQKI